MTLQHVSLELRRDAVPAEVDFWSLLGFARVEPPPGLVERAAWLQRDGTQIHLLFADAPVVPPEGHCAVVAEDFEAAVAALRDAGFEPEEHTRHWGAARAFVRTPGGHLVEVMAAPPA
jgi:catechol 2,3-dioxygenase-like lactoylglutathione lyase family enzyme